MGNLKSIILNGIFQIIENDTFADFKIFKQKYNPTNISITFLTYFRTFSSFFYSLIIINCEPTYILFHMLYCYIVNLIASRVCVLSRFSCV